jgi:quinoprotein glucose dehydrogenase
MERQDVSCLRCHKLDGQGGVAGPDLTGVASRHPRQYLLESIVNPNAQIAPGFESVTVKMKAGRNYAGVVKGETDAEVVIDAGDGATVHLDKKEVASRTKGLSPMPQDISKTLSKRDVRDLVEFLSSLKQPTTMATTTTQPATQQARGQ